MTWRSVVTAASDTPAGLHAAKGGLHLTVATVVPAGGAAPAALAAWSPQVLHGVPGIEVARLAEQEAADVLVIGRKVYAGTDGPTLGPTADAVVRRSRVPCLLVPEGQERFERCVLALDGTPRGLAVVAAAAEFARLVGAAGEAIHAVPGIGDDEVLGGESGRLRDLERALERAAAEGGVRCTFQLVRGDPARAVVEELTQPGTDVLVVGARRGGPGGPPPRTGVGRTLLYTAPCAVLTVPL
jgi:nucleotide-binding universal stress UspA family protein